MTITPRKRVAIIGAGASGLVSLKECLDEKELLDPVAFEQENHLGGLWRYVEISKENPNPHSSVYKSTIINTSKEMMAFSDYAIPANWATYLPNQKIAQYFSMYADRFGLVPHIRFGTKVLEVKELHDEQKRWLVRSQRVAAPGESEHEIKEEIFDYVMVCSGHHWKPRYPSFPGMKQDDPEPYTGEQIHSHFYRDVDAFRNKTVIVVGLGNSAVDLAVEMSMNQSQVYLSCRRAGHVVPRWILGKPTDQHRTRFTHMVPLFLMQFITAILFRISTPSVHENLKPYSKPFETHPTINSIFPERVTTGTIKPVRIIKKMGPGKRVEFEDGTVVENVDAVFYCTGYHISFPALHPDVVTDGKPNAEHTNQVHVWNYMIPPRHPNLAFVALLQPLGAIMPMAELQARFLVQTLVGKVAPLPTEDRMDKDIKQLHEDIRKRYDDAPRHTIQVDYAPYCDQLAKKIGCFPTLTKLIGQYGLIEGFKLKMETIFGPPIPVQYRLVGPHAWEGAREVVWGYANDKKYLDSKYLQDTSVLDNKAKVAEIVA
ncbi:Cyclopentanone 1,2-monooxygenase (CPMO) [Dissophora globulifera]|nr:Cyclopentanone 1,2-monooxygenase (CPMO) [Dissophora globulifera]